MPLADDQIQYVEENLLHFREEQNVVQQYFEHVFENSGLVQPNNWQEAEQLYFTLMAIANGTENNYTRTTVDIHDHVHLCINNI